MEINELVPNMAVVNPQAYNQLLKRQLTKTKKVGTALKNKKDPLHKRAVQLVKRLLKKEVKTDKVENMIRNLIRTEIKNIRESQMMTEEQFDEAAGKKDACYHKVKARYDVWPSAYASGALVKCRKVGAKNWGNKSKKESVEEAYDIWMEDGSWGYTMTGLLPEAEYQGRKVKLGKPMQGDVKKFKVYVKNPKGNVVKVNFGQGGDAKGGTMRIRKSNPNARKNFRARHNCDNPGPRHKARYWSCRKW